MPSDFLDSSAIESRHCFNTPEHRSWLVNDAHRQIAFFKASLRPEGGFFVLGHDGKPLVGTVQELHTTTRLVHSYALAKCAGADGCDQIIDHGLSYLWKRHRDAQHGGYLWALDGVDIHDDRKLAYGHVFVLLAGASAKLSGHPDADRLIDDVTEVLEQRFWEEDAGLFADEWNRDWTPFSDYRGMNANMHGVEALLTAFEATGRQSYLDKAGRILRFFIDGMALSEGWRLPEHYTKSWQIDRSYSGNPMFRPAGTTPGHSFELARLLLQCWDLKGRPNDGSPDKAWSLVQRALEDAWDAKKGGLAYTLQFDGTPYIRDRYWWPVTEAIGVLACFLKLGGTEAQKDWYARLWQFADAHFIDHEHGGWYPEIDAEGRPTVTQFNGKPDIYHALQATLIPLAQHISRLGENLHGLLKITAD
ncbi:AGE family epimerase/isomerase [Aliiroseovarius sp. 2305UL8-7]|uniref:AGE family epimerase/isomerase n=1 Tax=Aliiroseovarius conchicola TaxID=3121637 RepID=UPI003527CE11